MDPNEGQELQYIGLTKKLLYNITSVAGVSTSVAFFFFFASHTLWVGGVPETPTLLHI